MTAASRDRVARWVFDTNVVLSALVRPGGVTGRLRLAWQTHLVVPLVSQTTVLELVRVLAYPKFKLPADDQRDLLADYLPWTQTVRMPSRPPATPPCRDPDDLPFLQLAIIAKADVLVSGDADLLAVERMTHTAILTPAQAVTALDPDA